MLIFEAIRKIDPLELDGMNEPSGERKRIVKDLNSHPALGLQAIAERIDAGLWADAAEAADYVIDAAADEGKISPLVYYYRAYASQKINQPRNVTKYLDLAAKAPVDYAFPFQTEMIPVLEAAMTANPQDSRAPYYLGNLLFDSQPERAIALWKKSAELGADFPEVYHNLALGYTRQGKTEQREQAQAWLEKGASFGGNAMIFAELDKLYEENGVDPAKRLATIESHQAVINRDDIISREINLDIFAGRPEAALVLIKSRFFRAWEGGGRYSLGDTWVNAKLVLGRQQMAEKKYKDALAAFQDALQIPANLQEAAGNTAGRRGEIEFYIGTAYEALGEKEKAAAAFTEAAGSAAADAVAGAGRGGRGGRGGAGLPPGQFSGRGAMGGVASGTHVPDAAAYFQALAMQKLDQAGESKSLFQQILDDGNRAVAANGLPGSTAVIPAGTRTAIADAHYLAALGNMGLAYTDKAREELTAALKISPDHLAAHVAMMQLPTDTHVGQK